MEEEEIDIYGDLDDFDANEKLHKVNISRAKSSIFLQFVLN